ncbi:hypothetical protein [Sulfuriferula thiophila]|uniref:hypothetical protein n=1 Tax=Sulfuriferula thiophila TaxID=1781211 RepID=UPI000F60CC17|nr:hypothetical protein [Sulfuriferula thiophila]
MTSNAGAVERGAILFGYVLFGEQEKVTSRRATPGLLCQYEAPNSALTSNWQTAQIFATFFAILNPKMQHFPV